MRASNALVACTSRVGHPPEGTCTLLGTTATSSVGRQAGNLAYSSRVQAVADYSGHELPV